MSLKIYLGSRKDRLPIMGINAYVLITLFLYIFGPIRFHSEYSILMIMYMILFLIIINIAYFMAIRKVRLEAIRFKNIDVSSNIENTNRPLPFWFQMFGLLIPVFMIASSIALTGFSHLQGSISNTMAQSYTFTQSGGTYQQGIDIPMWIYMHLAVFVYLSIIDGVIYFRELSLLRKSIWIGTIFCLLGYFVLFKGTQKTLGDIFILIASSMLINTYLNRKNKKRTKKKSTIVLLIIVVIIFSNILASIMGERIAYLGSVGFNAFRISTEFWDVDLSSPLLLLFPESSRLGYACLIFYLCNGLCGLSYCLASPLTWSFGLGSIPDLAGIIGRRIGIDVFKTTYVYEAYQIYGWHHSEQWHTIFPWIASDWTFIGALFIMGIVAYIYAICWEEILQGKNKESIYMFCILNIIWLYLPANNQIMSTRITALIFVICTYMWIRRKRDVRKKIFFYEQKR